MPYRKVWQFEIFVFWCYQKCHSAVNSQYKIWKNVEVYTANDHCYIIFPLMVEIIQRNWTHLYLKCFLIYFFNHHPDVINIPTTGNHVLADRLPVHFFLSCGGKDLTVNLLNNYLNSQCCLQVQWFPEASVSRVWFIWWITAKSPLSLNCCQCVSDASWLPWADVTCHSLGEVNTTILLDDVTGSFPRCHATFRQSLVSCLCMLLKAQCVITDQSTMIVALVASWFLIYRPMLDISLFLSVCVTVVWRALYSHSYPGRNALNASDHIWTVRLLQADCTP